MPEQKSKIGGAWTFCVDDVRNILSKLHATSRHQATTYAVQEGLVRPTNRESAS